MRARHAISVVAVLVVGFAVKLFFFPAPPAEAEMVQTLNVSQMFLGKNIPEQKLHDPRTKFLPQLAPAAAPTPQPSPPGLLSFGGETANQGAAGPQ